MLRAGAALASGCAASLLPSPAVALTPQEAARNGIFDVKAFGASGVRAQNATGACQAAIDACTAAGGGTVRVPPGEYSVATIQLKDNVTLHVEAGATIFLSQDNPQFARGRRAMVFAENASNIGVTGRGTLDGLAQDQFVAMRGVDTEIAEEKETARAAGVEMKRYYRVDVQKYMLVLQESQRPDRGRHDPQRAALERAPARLRPRVGPRRPRLLRPREGRERRRHRHRLVVERDDLRLDHRHRRRRHRAEDASLDRRPASRCARPRTSLVTNSVLGSSSTAMMIGTETARRHPARGVLQHRGEGLEQGASASTCRTAAR